MMLVCGKSISQTDTKVNNKETNLVCVDTSIARKIGNDLVSGDVCKAEIKFLKNNFKLLQRKIIFKDSIIKSKQYEIDNFKNFIVKEKDNQLSAQKDISTKFEKEANSFKKSSVFYKITTFLSLLGFGVYAITH